MQIIIQGVGSVSGLLLIRFMAKEEYAWFTISASMLATLNLLADGGISTALTSVGGRLCQSPAEFSRLLRDGMSLAWRMCVLGIVLATPFFWHLFVRVGMPPAVIVGLLLLSIAAVWPVAFTSLLSVAARLHSRARQLQLAELAGGAARLGLTAFILWLGCGNALMVVAVAAAAVCFQAWIVWRQTLDFSRPEPSSESYRRELGGFVRALYANHLFFCIQGQIATWLISWLAGVGEVADLGALSRLAVLFSALGAPFVYLVAPSMARIQDRSILRRRFALAVGASFAGTAAVLALAAWQPGWFLWLLGAKYSKLGPELVLALASQGVGMISGICWGLMVVRGWVRHAWLNILLSCLGYAVGASLVAVDTVAGVLTMNLLASTPLLIWVLLRCWSQLNKPSQKDSPT